MCVSVRSSEKINRSALPVAMQSDLSIGSRTSQRKRRSSHFRVRPPNPPWSPLVPRCGKAALSFYYSDPLSHIPVREISHEKDPKPDPNLETLTFGLFSRCDRGMRARMVRQGIDVHFFTTKRAHDRVLTGYYRIGWHYKFPPVKRRSKRPQLDDYALAAKEARFVAPGFPLRDLTGYLRGNRVDNRFRTFRYIDEWGTRLLLQLLNDTPDATARYISEIHRLEKLTLKRDGRIYLGKSTGFNWKVAPQFMRLES